MASVAELCSMIADAHTHVATTKPTGTTSPATGNSCRGLTRAAPCVRVYTWHSPRAHCVCMCWRVHAAQEVASVRCGSRTSVLRIRRRFVLRADGPVCAKVHALKHTRTGRLTQIRAHKCIHNSTLTHTYTHLSHMIMHTHAYTHTHSRARAQTHAHTHTHRVQKSTAQIADIQKLTSSVTPSALRRWQPLRNPSRESIMMVVMIKWKCTVDSCMAMQWNVDQLRQERRCNSRRKRKR